MFRSYFILLTILILPFLIFADSETDFDVAKCYDVAQSNEDLKKCSSQDYHFADKKLVQLFLSISEHIKSRMNAAATDASDPAAETLSRLENAEKAWITYREAQCQYEGTVMLGAESETIVVSGCLSRLTKERVKMMEESLASYQNIQTD
ncbi:MAG: DUF1311 domain-containing protein [Bdellovibrionaceae bacterium]|nr:DUF1311 domain-containing protein [Pseudobdellovibrionaceae bacterium]